MTIRYAVSIQYRYVRDRRTDGRTDGRTDRITISLSGPHCCVDAIKFVCNRVYLLATLPENVVKLSLNGSRIMLLISPGGSTMQ